MKKNISYVLALALCLALLCGCGKVSIKKETVPPVPTPIVFQGGEFMAEGLTDLSIVLQPGETALLDGLTQLQKADFSGSECIDEIYAWAQSHPDVKVKYTVTLPGGATVSSSETKLDLSSLGGASAAETAATLKYLPKLGHIELGAQRPGFGWAEYELIANACPGAELSFGFSIYGKDFNTADTIINLSHIPVEDDGAAVIEAMAHMPNLVSVDMDSCGVPDEQMAYIRDLYPDVKVIWRVWFGYAYTARTDVERILASQPSVGGMLTPEDCIALKYCTDVKYLDLGHNDTLYDISFVKYMPKLEVAVLAMDNWTDASPLAYCTELEYLEMQTTLCTDLSPLSGLTKLRHLNVAYIPELTDISPLYSLTELERLWLGSNNRVPMEQVEQMQAAAPNCEINVEVYEDPTGGRWRYVGYNELAYIYIEHPRYIKLREQFGYTHQDFSFYWNDPLC